MSSANETVEKLQAKKEELESLLLKIKPLQNKINLLQSEIKALEREHTQATLHNNYIGILKEKDPTLSNHEFVIFPNDGECRVEKKEDLYTYFPVTDLNLKQIIIDKANKLFVLVNLTNFRETPQLKNLLRDVYIIEEVKKCETISRFRTWSAKTSSGNTLDVGFQAKLKLKFSAKYDEVTSFGRSPKGWESITNEEEYILRFDSNDAREHFINNFNFNVSTRGGKRIKMKTFVKVIDGKKRVIHTGSKGGKYFIRNKKKVYLKKVKH